MHTFFIRNAYESNKNIRLNSNQNPKTHAGNPHLRQQQQQQNPPTRQNLRTTQQNLQNNQQSLQQQVQQQQSLEEGGQDTQAEAVNVKVVTVSYKC